MRGRVRADSGPGRLFPLRRFGWALLLAWVFCVFYTGVVEGYSGVLLAEAQPGNEGAQIVFGGLPVFMSVLMLLCIVAFERRLGSPGSHPVLFWIAPLATALSTPLMFWTGGDYLVSTSSFAVGAVLTGFGSGLMWVMWGEYYARMPQEEVEHIAPISAIIAAVLVLLVSSMSGWVVLVVVATFPLLSGWGLLLSWQEVRAKDRLVSAEKRDSESAHPGSSAIGSPLVALGHMGRGGFGILLACLFVCIAGTFWTMDDRRSWSFQAALFISILFIAAIAFISTVGPRRISISFLYRWMCSALVVAFAALILGGIPDGAYIAYVISLSARFAFCLITQMFFARYAACGNATPVQAFGFGWIFVHLGDFLGVLLSVFIDAGLASSCFGITQVAAVSIVVLVIGTMFVINDERGFSLDFGEAYPERRRASTSSGEYGGRSSEVCALPLVDELSRKVASVAHEHDLTPREVEVFDLLARGRSIPYIRDALVISRETASTHAKHVYSKLGVHSRQELIDLVQ